MSFDMMGRDPGQGDVICHPSTATKGIPASVDFGRWESRYCSLVAERYPRIKPGRWGGRFGYPSPARWLQAWHSRDPPGWKSISQHLRRLNVRLYQLLPLSPPHTPIQFDPNAQKNSTSSSNIEQIMLKLHFRKADYTVSTAFLFKLLQLQKWQSCILMIRKRFAACRGISDLVETTCIAFWWSAQAGKRQQQELQRQSKYIQIIQTDIKLYI